jgi:hypothetical protein
LEQPESNSRSRKANLALMSDLSVVPTDDVIIRRYIKMHRFVELLYGLFVQVRADAFDDAAEGAYFTATTRFAESVFQNLAIQEGAAPAQIVRQARLRTMTTCWYEGERESFGMWNVYSRLRESVAIESTVGQLRAVLRLSNSESRIERVRYSQLDGLVDDFASLFLHKREEYNYEGEIRSVWTRSPSQFGGQFHNTRLDLNQLGTFLNRIILAPGSGQTFLEAVRFIVEAAFHIGNRRFNGRIDRSNLDTLLVPQHES